MYIWQQGVGHAASALQASVTPVDIVAISIVLPAAVADDHISP